MSCASLSSSSARLPPVRFCNSTAETKNCTSIDGTRWAQLAAARFRAAAPGSAPRRRAETRRPAGSLNSGAPSRWPPKRRARRAWIARRIPGNRETALRSSARGRALCGARTQKRAPQGRAAAERQQGSAVAGRHRGEQKAPQEHRDGTVQEPGRAPFERGGFKQPDGGLFQAQPVEQPSRQAALHGVAFRNEPRTGGAAALPFPGRLGGQPAQRRRSVAALQGARCQPGTLRRRPSRPTERLSCLLNVDHLVESSTGSRMPAARSFSLHFGKMPEAANLPRTLPWADTPRFSNMNTSCRVTMSVSIPVTSVTLVTRREPSLKRAHCTSRCTAEAICWRMAVRCMLAFARETITSRREMASRGRVGVHRGQRAVVPRVHGLQHVERLFPAHLAHDNAVRPHAQAIDQQLALRTAPLPSSWRPRFETRHDAAASVAARRRPRWSRCAPWGMNAESAFKSVVFRRRSRRRQ